MHAQHSTTTARRLSTLGSIDGCARGTWLLVGAALAGVRLVAKAIQSHRKTKQSHRSSAMLSLLRQISDKVVEAVARLGEVSGRLMVLIYLVKFSTS